MKPVPPRCVVLDRGLGPLITPFFARALCASSTSHLKCMSCGSRGLYQVKMFQNGWALDGVLRTNTFHLRLEAVWIENRVKFKTPNFGILLHLICKRYLDIFGSQTENADCVGVSQHFFRCNWPEVLTRNNACRLM